MLKIINNQNNKARTADATKDMVSEVALSVKVKVCQSEFLPELTIEVPLQILYPALNLIGVLGE
jgi:hypothetical protein